MGSDSYSGDGYVLHPGRHPEGSSREIDDFIDGGQTNLNMGGELSYDMINDDNFDIDWDDEDLEHSN